MPRGGVAFSEAYLDGESEQRFGTALAEFPREELFLSTKLGGYLRQPGASAMPGGGDYILDYTYDTALRSIERSLARRKVDRLDAVYIHDRDPGFAGTAYRDELESAAEGAFVALRRLKEENVVGAIGVASMDWRAQTARFGTKQTITLISVSTTSKPLH